MPARTVRAHAPAKVNLGLAVGAVRDDGFHELATIYQAVDVYDTVTVTRQPAGAGVTLTVSGFDANKVPKDNTNLVWKAAELLAECAEETPDFAIHIEKNIPVAGGMAGGSADAAACLLACDALLESSLTRTRLMELAAMLGSDVAFSLHGGTALGTGRGEIVTPAMVRGDYRWVFAVAQNGLSTPAVYAEWDRLRKGRVVKDPQLPPDLMEGLLIGDPEAVGQALHNDLQAAAISLRPELDLVLDIGRDGAALGSIVSGSGPTVAFLVADEEEALDLTVSLAASGFCRTVIRAKGPVPGARLDELDW